MSTLKRQVYDDPEDIEEAFQKRRKVSTDSSVPALGLASPPVTPEKKVKLIQVDDDDLAPVARKLNFSEEIQSPYSRCKEIFLRGSAEELEGPVLPGRETEADLLNQYIEKSLAERKPVSIYVSGPPGTGKTAQVNAILSKIHNNRVTFRANHKDVSRSVQVIQLNCMTLRSADQIYSAVAESITGKKRCKKEDLRQILAESYETDMTILVLDEMDSVINKYQQALFELFTWASPILEKSPDRPRLILIGIANALDLTDRFLPRLRSNLINPKVVQFLPYTADQIKRVITAKLRALAPECNLPPFVHPTAILFCAKKAAVTTGDLRKAFDVLHQAIETVEQSTIKRLPKEEFDKLTASSAPRVMIAQVAKVCSTAFDTNYQPRMDSLNLQSKTVLCCLFKFEEKRAQTTTIQPPSINYFFEFYKRHLHSVDRMLTTLKRGEFLEILSSLEANSLVNLQSLADTGNRFSAAVSGSVGGAGGGSSKKHVLSFGNYKVSSNVPKSQLIKSIYHIEILCKVMSASDISLGTVM